MERSGAQLSRREMLRLSGAGLLALGLGSSALADPAPEPALFRFIVINDIHCRDERCHPWFQKIAASMRAHDPAFCLINGDLAENGRPDQYAAVKQIFGGLGVPLYATIGNHDYLPDPNHGTATDHSPFDKFFPGSINYHFEHAGWQFIGLDSTQGQLDVFTEIPPATLAWMDKALPPLSRTKPTVAFTHFPLGDFIFCRPVNSPELLSRFDTFNLRATFSGHWHGYAERHFEHAIVTNSRCGSWWRGNNDGSPEKGYFLCEPTASGEVRRQFCVVV